MRRRHLHLSATDPTATHHTGRSPDHVVPIIIAIVMMPMMVPLPAIFVGVMIVAVAVVPIVGSVWLESGANENAKAIVCFGFGGR